MTTTPTAAPPKIGRLRAARLLHPCRFYAYGWLFALLLVLLVVAAVVGEWQAPALAIGALLLMVPGIEAAARSTVGPADVLRAYRESQR